MAEQIVGAIVEGDCHRSCGKCSGVELSYGGIQRQDMEPVALKQLQPLLKRRRNESSGS
jgi:hypothetical protein